MVCVNIIWQQANKVFIIDFKLDTYVGGGESWRDLMAQSGKLLNILS